MQYQHRPWLTEFLQSSLSCIASQVVWSEISSDLKRLNVACNAAFAALRVLLCASITYSSLLLPNAWRNQALAILCRLTPIVRLNSWLKSQGSRSNNTAFSLNDEGDAIKPQIRIGRKAGVVQVLVQQPETLGQGPDLL